LGSDIEKISRWGLKRTTRGGNISDYRMISLKRGERERALERERRRARGGSSEGMPHLGDNNVSRGKIKPAGTLRN